MHCVKNISVSVQDLSLLLANKNTIFAYPAAELETQL